MRRWARLLSLSLCAVAALVGALSVGSRLAARADDGAGGTIVTAAAPSAALHGDVDFELYLPPGYDSSTARYPTLYLMHGRGDSMAAWTREKADLDRLIADGSIPPAIVVMPDAPWSARGSWYVNSRYTGKDYPGQPVETALDP